jgi:hypothetical protein
VFPSLPLDRPHFSLFTKSFLASKNVEERKFSYPGMPLKVFGIPKDLARDFVDQFYQKFSYLEELKDYKPEEQVSKAPEKHALEDSAEEAQRKMQRKEAKTTAIHKSGLHLYNRLLEGIMPTYSETPKAFRLEFKKLTRDFLAEKLGGQDNLGECTLSYVHENHQRSTYGIPMRFESDYKKWAAAELRERFGEEKVPVIDF